MNRTCQTCGKAFRRSRGKFCCISCYHTSQKGKAKSSEHKIRIGQAHKGVPKPSLRGERNPNYKNKARSSPEIILRMKEAYRRRGQGWSSSDLKAHSERMKTSINKMRGATHTEETKLLISRKTLERLKRTSPRPTFRTSKAEAEILAHLLSLGHEVKSQAWFKGGRFVYDFFLPELNLILEYQGDFWHANPLHYSSGQVLNFPGGPKSVEEIWEKDERKRRFASSVGMLVRYIWETEYLREGMSVVDTLLEEFK